MLTLSNEGRVVAKRMISAAQRNDPQRLKRLVQSIQFGIAIEQGHSAMAILAVMTDGDRQLLQPPPAQRPVPFSVRALKLALLDFQARWSLRPCAAGLRSSPTGT